MRREDNKNCFTHEEEMTQKLEKALSDLQKKRTRRWHREGVLALSLAAVLAMSAGGFALSDSNAKEIREADNEQTAGQDAADAANDTAESSQGMSVSEDSDTADTSSEDDGQAAASGAGGASESESGNQAGTAGDTSKTESKDTAGSADTAKSTDPSAGAQADDAEADLTADVETASDWEKTLPKKMAHEKADATVEDYQADIVAVAESQIDYEESEDNFILTKDKEKAFWNRYGAWADDAYADPWDEEFAAFVLHYAGVTGVPLDGDTTKWAEKLEKAELYADASYEAEAGDIVFMQEEDGTFHAAIITDVKEKKNADRLTIVGATVGEERDFVEKEKIDADDARIVAYSPVAEAMTQEEDAAASEIEEAKAEDAGVQDASMESEGAEAETAEIEQPVQELNAVVYTNASMNTISTDVRIKVSGALPEGISASACPVPAGINGEETYAVYRLILRDADGNEYHSQADDDISITVTINDSSLTKALLGNESAHGWHKNNGTVEDMSFTLLPDGGVQFEADVF